MKTIVLDENLPVPLRHCFPGFELFTVKYLGWSGLKNGELLNELEGQFDIFISADKNLRYQQNIQGRSLCIIELPFSRMDQIQKILEKVQGELSSITTGQYRVIEP